MKRACLSVCLISVFAIVFVACNGGGGGGGDGAPSSYTLSGAVTLNGTGYEGVTVTLGGDADDVALTDATGSFSFDIPDGNYTLTPALASQDFSPAALPVSISGADSPGNDFTLVTYSAYGTVTMNLAGREGVTVTASATGMSSCLATTALDGTFTISGLLNADWTITPTYSGQTFTPENLLAVVNGGSVTDRDFDMDTWDVSGRVTLNGSGSAGVGVALNGDTSLVTSTNGSGDYTFAGLMNGNYSVAASSTGQGFAPTSHSIAVSGSDISGNDFAFKTYVLAGQVTLNGSGYENATVDLSGDEILSTSTDSSGAYSFAGLVNGSYILTPTLSSQTFSPADTSFAVSYSSVSSLDFALDTYTVSGQVTWEGSGYSGASVALDGDASFADTTNGTGAYSFPGLLNGSYTVTPTVSGQSVSPVNQAVAVSMADTTLTDFTLDTFTISGQVTHGGSGESGVSMALFGMAAGAATTDGTGSYSFSGLLNGSYNVTPTLYGQSFVPASTTVSIASTSQASVDFNIPQMIWFVDINSPAGTPDGLSWETAFFHPQNGSDMAASGDQVWVGEGTYASMDTVTSMPVLSMKDSVDYYGRFAGNEGLLSERDLSAHTTTLDGEGIVSHVVIGANNSLLDGFDVINGYAESASGAGMYNEDVQNITVSNCYFASNLTTGLPSVPYVNCGGGIVNINTSASLHSNVFENNQSSNGGGIFNYSSSVLIDGNRFISNIVSESGGGIKNESSTATITNSLFLENSAIRNGAGASAPFSTVEYINCTFFGNQAGDNGGATYSHDSEFTIKNSILYGNSPNEIYNVVGGTTAVEYSNVEGGYPGAGNIDVDPEFYGPAEDDYRLRNSSPCLDVGDNSTVTTSYDLAGADRIQDTTVDMGAYEGGYTYVPKVVHVDINSAASEPDGLSWATAFTHPYLAVNYANADDEIWVAEGTYATLDTSDATVPVLEMKDGVLVYGGFAGTESSLTQRDPDVYIATLDGEDFVNHIVIGASDARLDGFFITRGNAGSASGAGMSNEGVTGLQVMNSVFASNVATGDGGGMHNDNAEVEVGNCVFRNNSAYHGGGIENYSNCNMVVYDTVFDSNIAAGGGAMHNGGGAADGYIGGHNVDMYNCLVINNIGSVNGGGVTYVNSTGRIENTTITGNTAASNGGGNYNHAGTPQFFNSIIYGNGPNQVFNAVSGGASITYSDVQGGYAGAGNINSNPLFIDSANGNYRLGSTSPCIDTGSNAAVGTSLDLDGNTRIADGPDMNSTATVDMGAFEYVNP